ncbi:MAG: hypothetical protein M3480_01915 [Verrucomicrobiota bacterium]|nr:hypothetical protein [Verrucomicrobiota bacterium]
MQAPRFQEKNISMEQLALAQEAFLQFRTRCFWFLRPDLRVTIADFPLIIRGLRLNGGRAGFALADRLCR